MDEASLLVAAHRWIQRGSDKDTRKATAILRRRGVSNLTVAEDLSWATAAVDDIGNFEPALEFDAKLNSWELKCDCEKKTPCVHQLSLCSALIQGAPRTLAKSRPVTGTGLAPEVVLVQLRDYVRSRLQRPLAVAESQFLSKVSGLFRLSHEGIELQETHLWQLDWPGRVPSYQPLEAFGELPKTEVEFWFVLADLARERGYSIPAFLQKLEAPRELEDILQKQKQAREIAQWRQALNRLPKLPPKEGQERRLQVRFRWARREVMPEIQEGEGGWRPLRPNQIDTFHRQRSESLGGSAAGLWNSYFLVYWHHGRLTDHSLPMQRWLNAHLQSPATAALIVDESEQPFQISDTPLRWQLREPDRDGGEYALELVDSEGRPVGPILAQLAGNPILYRTAAGIFRGPPAVLPEVTPERLKSIPAKVMESGLGIRLLQWARVEPPDRVRAKIRVITLKVTLTLKIDRTDGRIMCRATGLASGPDGSYLHKLEPSGWTGQNRELADEVHVDLSNAQRVVERLREAGFEQDLYGPGFSLKLTRDFPEMMRRFLDSVAEVANLRLCPELTSLRDGQMAGTVRLEAMEASPDWFDLRVVVRVEDTSLTPEELQALVSARGKWVKLGDRWRRLDYEVSSEEEKNLARIGLTPRQLGAEPQRLHALQLSDPSARRLLPEATAELVERRASELRARVSPEIPSAIRAELRPYQRDGFHFLAYLAANGFGGVLADDMGLGKTLQTLTWLAWLRHEGAATERRGRPSLVVCPKSVQDNWRAEAERFYPELRVHLWREASEDEAATRIAAADLHVINYAQLRTAQSHWESVDFLTVILDEGQNIKNPSSLTTQVARKLKADYRLILTGTPIENRLLDLWSLMSFAMPGVLGSRNGFGRLYDAKEDPLARTRLSARVRPFLLRRTKAQVARELPDRVEEDLYCELEGEQRALYRAELKLAQQALLSLKTEKSFNQQRFHFLTSLLRLRQICCHPGLIHPDSKQSGAKVEALLETLEPLLEEGEKVLVFSQFVGLLALLKPALEERGWKQWYLAGETENRGDLVKDFQAHQGGGVFLISLKAGGAGLNLTAASYVVLFDPWWNPAVENQAIDRTHRIGQTRKILAYRLLIKGSIEEKIRKLQKTKSALADEVLGEERFASALTLDDLRFLLGDPE